MINLFIASQEIMLRLIKYTVPIKPAFILVIVVTVLLVGSVGLTVEPGSGIWWLLRPVWLSIYAVALMGLVLVFLRFERGARSH